MNPQPDLFTPAPRFDGATFDPAYDQDRLTRQIGRVYAALESGRWLTVSEIAAITGDRETSISAQLRNLRKVRFGGHEIQRRHRGDRKLAIYEFRLGAE